MSSPTIFDGTQHKHLRPIASGWHTCGLLLILAAPAIISASRIRSSPGKPDHLLLYAIAIVFECAGFAFCLWHTDVEFTGYIARVLKNPRALLLDIPVALILAAVLLSLSPVIVRILGHNGWVSIQGMLPRGRLEIAIWIVIAIIGAASEEVVFRGYLQQQISGWTKHVFMGIVGQAIIFGLCHAYEGWKSMVLISVWGCVFGVFAWYRKGLRANIIAHAAIDLIPVF